jgi:hypothetical protein
VQLVETGCPVQLAIDTPSLQISSNVANTEVICRPVDFPTNDPPYAEREINIYPYPLISGQRTRACVTLVNNTDNAQTVSVEFFLASLGIGLPTTSIPSISGPNPRSVLIPAHSAVDRTRARRKPPGLSPCGQGGLLAGL